MRLSAQSRGKSLDDDNYKFAKMRCCVIRFGLTAVLAVEVDQLGHDQTVIKLVIKLTLLLVAPSARATV